MNPRLPPDQYYPGTYRCPADPAKRCPWCEDGPEEEDGVIPTMCGYGELIPGSKTDADPSR